tara:strand:+ start:641 stop:754 length:114 start_codon:yes stop_codon:yes gene_type:complete
MDNSKMWRVLRRIIGLIFITAGFNEKPALGVGKAPFL